MAEPNITLLLTANKDVERFLAQVNIPNNLDDCWEWQKSRKSGYGRFKNKTDQYAHRFIFLSIGGSLSKETPYVLHSCDNRICVNPTHLRAGTPQENSDDMVSRGRGVHPKGEAHGAYRHGWYCGKKQSPRRGKDQLSPKRIMRKLSHGKAKLIKAMYETGHFSIRKIAAIPYFGVKRQAIQKITSGITWRAA